MRGAFGNFGRRSSWAGPAIGRHCAPRYHLHPLNWAKALERLLSRASAGVADSPAASAPGGASGRVRLAAGERAASDHQPLCACPGMRAKLPLLPYTHPAIQLPMVNRLPSVKGR